MGDEDGQEQNDEKSSVEAKETTRKIIRVITVIAYLCSVSMAAIILSLYYLFFWNPTVRAGPERLVNPIQLPLRQFHAKISGGAATLFRSMTTSPKKPSGEHMREPL